MPQNGFILCTITMFRLELHRRRQGGNESEKCMIYYVTVIIIKSQLELQGDSHRAIYTLHHLS